MKQVSKKVVAFFAIMLVAMTMFAISANCANFYEELAPDTEPVAAAVERGQFDYKAGDILYVNVGSLFVHRGWDASEATRIDQIGRGTKVKVLAVNAAMRFINISYTSPLDGRTRTGCCAAYDGYFVKGSPAPVKPTETKYSGHWLANVTAVNGLKVHTTPYIVDTNLRAQLLQYNWVVKALAYTSNGMVKVQYYKNNNRSNTEEGYVSKEYLYLYKASAQYLAVDKHFSTLYGYTARVNSSNLNVHRDLAFWGNDLRVFATLKKGTMVNVIKRSTHWYYVSFKMNGKLEKGYIRREHATLVNALKNVKISSKKVKMELDESGIAPTVQLKVLDTTTPSPLKKTYKWKSEDKSVVRVDQTGLLKAKGEGVARVTCKVKVGNRTKVLKCKVVVKMTETDDDV